MAHCRELFYQKIVRKDHQACCDDDKDLEMRFKGKTIIQRL